MKLQAFLYLLIRDEITIGKVERIMQGLQLNADEDAKFTCPELAEYAKDLKERLLNG